jgi:5-keto 4-deoxyuronate isomerase
MRIASDSRWDELQRQLHDRRKEARVYYLCLFGSLLGIMFLLMGKR